MHGGIYRCTGIYFFKSAFFVSDDHSGVCENNHKHFM
nr:MAG TPA: hypothetical protein [Caudoviricetes sp.]